MGFLFDNDRGFTLIPTLLALVIIVIVLPILSFILSKLTEPKVFDDIKYEQFFHYIYHDALRADSVHVHNNTIVFAVRTGDQAVLSRHKDVIRRQVEGVGHEIYARDVKSFTAEQEEHCITVKIISTKGDIYGKTIPIYK